MRPGASAIAVALLACAASLAARGTGAQQAVFRAGTDAVFVDVTVELNGAAVSGLSAADFVLTDNSVAQKVESIDPGTMPLDLTILEDLSYATRSPWRFDLSPQQIIGRVNKDLKTMAALLGPEDRIQLLTIDTYVHQNVPMQPPAGVSVSSIVSDGLTSLYDGLAIAMLRQVEATRRHLVLAGVKGIDHISVVDAGTIKELAKTSDAALHIVERDESQAGDRHNLRPRAYYPHRRSGLTVLAEAAVLSGGAMHAVGAFGEPDLIHELQEIVARFRGGYLLRYSPQAVRREGWHEIAVRVPKHPNATVRARRGYAVEVATPAREAERPARPAASVDDFAALFNRGDAAATQAALRQVPDLRTVIRQYRENGTPWPAAPKRDAIFVLELAAASVFGRDAATRDAALDLLRWYEDLVRPTFEADGFECAWHGAVASLLQGTLRAAVAIETVDRQLTRCPADARLYLARAIVSDQLASTSTARADVSREALAEIVAPGEVLRRYEAAMKYPDVAEEARIRAAWLAFRSGIADQAMTHLEALSRDAGGDPVLRYFGHLVRAQVLRGQARFDEAASAYRAALAAWPGAQSARVGLMTLLVTTGDRQEAESLAEAIQAAPANEFDPWWFYWQGQFLEFPASVARLREMAR